MTTLVLIKTNRVGRPDAPIDVTCAENANCYVCLCNTQTIPSSFGTDAAIKWTRVEHDESRQKGETMDNGSYEQRWME